MANNKKIFSIQINGVEQASKSVDSLYEKIISLQKAINSMKKVDIPITIGGGDKKLVDEISKLKKELNSLKETAKDIDLGSEEYTQASEKVNQLTKDFTKLDSSIKKRNIESLKDTLKDATEEADDLSESVNDIKKKFDSIKGIKLDTNAVKRYGLSINDLKWQISQLEKSIEGMSIGSEQWQATNRELLDLKQTLALVQKEMEAAVRAEDQLGTKIKMNINGMTLEFDDVNQAIGILEDKMYALAAAGKQNTKEFKDMADAASKLKIQVKAVDTQIDAMSEGGIGINKALSYTQGFTSIATGAQGLAGLFGSGEDMTRTIATMTSLMGVLQAVQSIKQQMAQGDAFGQMLTKWNVLMNQLLKPLNNLQNGLNSLSDSLTKLIADKASQLSNLGSTFDGVIQAMRQNASQFGVSINVNDKDLKVVEQYINKLRELQNIQKTRPLSVDETIQLQGVERMIGLLTQAGTSWQNASQSVLNFNDAWKLAWTQLKNGLSVVGQSIKNFFTLGTTVTQAGNNAVKATVGFKAMTAAIKTATAATKALSAAFKATIILFIIDLLMQLVDLITTTVGKVIDWAKGNDTLVNSLDTVKSRIDATTSSIERYNKAIDKLKDSGNLSEFDAMAKKMDYLAIQTKKAVNELQQFVTLRNKAKSLEESSSEDGGSYTMFGIASNVAEIDNATERLREFERVYKDLMTVVEADKDENFNSGFSAIFFSKGDARSDLAVMQKKVIEDIQYQINNIDISKGKEELKSFFDTIDSEMYSTSLANIENLYPEEEWAKVLNQRLDALRNMYEQWDEMSNQQRINEINNLKEVNKQIRDNNTEAIADEYERQKQSLQNQLDDEIKSAQGNEELIVSIKKKYNRIQLDLEKQHNEQLKSEREAEIEKQKSDAEALNAVLRQIRDNQLSIEEESLDKRIKTLENAKNDEIQAAKDGGIKVAELTLSIEQKYNKLIEKERKNHLDYLNNLAEDYARKQIELQQSLKEDELNNESRTIDINYNTSANSSSGSFDFNAQYGDRIQAEKEFSQQRLNIELQYLQEKLRLDKEYAKLENEGNTIEENNRYNDRLKELKSYHEEGKLSLDEYNSYVEKENELHSQKLQQIERQLTNSLSALEDEYNNDYKSKTSQSLTENVNLYSEYSRQVMDIMSGVGRNRNMFGIISFSDAKKEMDNALNVINSGVRAIDAEIADLTNKLNNNEITFVDYKDARQQLEDTKKELISQGKGIAASMGDLFAQVASGWKGVFDGFVSQVSSLLATLNDTQMTLIDNQLSEIERQLEIQEEAYERAEEAAQSHKDKMDSIEDELAESRGSRRQFLIDTLAAQQEAYLEDVAAQQEAEAEKEKLEKKQQALEKKRQEQEKKAKVQQAIINTYMAVSNALAVQPWFVGLALSAVALALGLRNVAAIKSTPIYEDGGVIQGKRHSQGGVKVLGGQAEVEGGEFITNRKSTAKNLPLLTYINDKKREVTPQELMEFFSNGTPKMKSKSTRMFADGGMLPTTDGSEINRIISVNDTSEDNSTYVVQVVDIINATENLKKVQTLSGLVNE